MHWYFSLTIGQNGGASGPSDAPPPLETPQATNGGNGEQTGETAPTTGDDGQPAPRQSGDPFGSMLWMMVIMFVIVWLLILVPQRRDKKRRESLLSSIKKGDRVQTIGGILGRVTEVKEHEVVIKVDEKNNTHMTFAKAAVQANLSGSDAPAAPTAEKLDDSK